MLSLNKRTIPDHKLFNFDKMIQSLDNFSTDNLKDVCRILIEKNYKCFFTNDVFSKLDLVQKVNILTAIFATKYYKLMDDNLTLFSWCYSCLRETSEMYTKYSLASLRNMVSFCKSFSEFLLPSQDLWSMIYLNLDVPFQGSREQSIILLQMLVVRDTNFAYNLFDEIINFWSWTNKYKYHILGVIFANFGFYHIMQRHKNIDRKYFLLGTTIALKYKHLLSPSHALVRVLFKQDVAEFFQVLRDVFRNGSNYEFENCINQWMIQTNNTEQFYNVLGIRHMDADEFLNEDYLKQDNYRRAISLRNLLRQNFESSFDDLGALDDFVLDQLDQADIFTKLNILEIFVHKLIKSKGANTKNIEPLRIIIQNSFDTDCPAMRNVILKKISILVDYLAKIHTCTKDELVSKTILDFLIFLKKDIYNIGIAARGNYQILIFSLKLYDILMKTFTTGVNKSTNRITNDKFKQILIEKEIWTFSSQDEFYQLFSLLNSEFDDVRELALSILIGNFIENTPVDVSLLAKSKCFDTLEDDSAAYCNFANLYCRLYTQQVRQQSKYENIVELRIELFERLQHNLIQFVDDPLLACRSKKHIFPVLDCLNEIYKCQVTECLAGKFSIDLITMIESVATKMLDLLNMAGKAIGKEAPDFEMMDKGLQILVDRSGANRQDDNRDRKTLLLTIWLTLKSCAEMCSAIGIYVMNTNEKDIESIQRCLNVNILNLSKCRHKGVIEAAGLSFGRLVSHITSNYNENHEIYKILYTCFPVLFENVKNTSTTRRGAGFSIMMHHLVKNDNRPNRPLLLHTMELLLNEEQIERSDIVTETKENCDNMEASVLHYLCVLVKDASLREDIMPFMEQIMIVTFEKISSTEWKTRNAALQLFGSIIPKILGQRQYYDESAIEWEPTHLTFDEIIIKMARLNQYILKNLRENIDNFKSTSLIILFLEFLSKTEIRKLKFNNNAIIFEYNRIFWTLLRHGCEKIRILSAQCLTMFHEFRLNIPVALDNIISIMFLDKTMQDENFLSGIIQSVIFMLKKYSNEIQFVESRSRMMMIEQTQQLIRDNYKFPDKTLSFYIRRCFLDLFEYLNFDLHEKWILQMIFMQENVDRGQLSEELLRCSDDVRVNFGHDLWMIRVKKKYY